MSTSVQGEARQHYRALDGLRAVAALLVIYYHSSTGDMHLPFSQLGWVGVDLFFVLSGFPITSVLLKTRETANYFRVFYARRALRIFPIYYSAVIAVFCAHRWAPHYPTYGWTTQIWYWINASNVPTAMLAHGIPDLTHFWTLAIEEQFYLLWPILVYNVRNRVLLCLCIAAVPLEYALRLLPAVVRMDALTDHQFSQRLTPLHSEGLFAGAAVAIMLWEGIIGPSTLKLTKLVGASVGVLALLFIRWNSAPHWIFASRLSLLALGCAALVAVLVVDTGESLVPRILSSPALKSMGRMSFSIYVLHLPIINYMRVYVFSRPPTRAILLGHLGGYLLVTVMCAHFVWRILEEPALALKRHFLYRTRPKDVGSVPARAKRKSR
jgi:peptidoglycan/LPS O-acetylase OafA/YrhL